MIHETNIPSNAFIHPDEATAQPTQPVDGTYDASSEEWTLADLEYPMPPVFLQNNIVFKMDNVDTDEATARLKHALDLVSRQCRTLAGVFRKESGEVKIVRDPGATIPFVVEHKWSVSYEQLEAEGFPGSHISARAVLRETSMADAHSITSGNNVCEIKATWISGGLIITFGYHHYCLDGSGSSAFLRMWAETSRALQEDSQLPSWDSGHLNRDRLRGQFVPPEQRVDPGLPAPQPQCAIPPRAAPIDHFVVLRLQKDQIISLKTAATTHNEKISSYDAVTALVWRVLTRARLSIYSPEPGEATFVGQAVNIRNRLTPHLCAELQANATLGVLTPPLAIGDAVAPGSLGFLASLVRQAHANVDEQTILYTANRVARMRDKTLAAWRGTHAPRFGVAVSDFRGGMLYELDFGFGKPVALRNVYQPGHPCVIHSASAGRGVEVQIPVEGSCLDIFVQDAELLQYAEVIIT